MSQSIAFKGVSDGIYLEIKTNDTKLVKKEIEKTMKKSSKFFKGSKLLGVEGENISEEDKLDLVYMLKYIYDFNVDEIDINQFIAPKEDVNENIEDVQEEEKIIVEKEEVIIEINKKSEVLDEGITKFIHGTVRSGQEIDFEGNIVVVGDVNPGAHLKAEGNIIVLGSLRGIAYAGLKGNKKAIVAAYNLLPTQLRIANIIVRAPDGDEAKDKVPEVAKIVKDNVIIEPYLPNK